MYLFQVLDDGKVIEFDAPYLLLQNANSFLYKLVEQTGKAEALHLMEIAEAAFKKEELPGPLHGGNVTIAENPGAENENVIVDNVKLSGLDANINENAVNEDVRVQKAAEIVKTALENALNEISGQEKAELERNEKENQEKDGQEMKEWKSDVENKIEIYKGEMNEKNSNELTEDQVDETEVTALLAKEKKESKQKKKESREKDGIKGEEDKSSDSSSSSSSDSDNEETALIDKSSGVGANQKSD